MYCSKCGHNMLIVRVKNRWASGEQYYWCTVCQQGYTYSY